MSNLESNELLEEARRLLPWYLTDKLSKAEQGLVNQALEQYPELQHELAQEEKMMRIVRTNTSLLELSALDTTEQRLNKLLVRIDRADEKLEEPTEATQLVVEPEPLPSQATRPASNSHNTSVMNQPKTQIKKNWFDFLWRQPLFNLEWLTPANAVFASLVIAQVAVLAYNQFNTKADSQFTVASVETPHTVNFTADGKTALSRFLVQFADNAKHQEVCEFLNKWQAHIVAGPNAQSIFTIEMPVAPNIDKVALADSIMQQTAQQSSPVLFLGPQFEDKTPQ